MQHQIYWHLCNNTGTFCRYMSKLLVRALEEANCLETTADRRSSKILANCLNEDCFLESRKDKMTSFLTSDCCNAIPEELIPLVRSEYSSLSPSSAMGDVGLSLSALSSSMWVSYSHCPIQKSRAYCKEERSLKLRGTSYT